jgi:hypothetical protein
MPNPPKNTIKIFATRIYRYLKNSLWHKYVSCIKIIPYIVHTLKSIRILTEKKNIVKLYQKLLTKTLPHNTPLYSTQLEVDPSIIREQKMLSKIK